MPHGPKFDAGLYTVRVTAQGFDESREKKTPYFFLEFQPQFICDSEGREVAQCADDICETKLHITDNTIKHVLVKLAKLGWYGNDLAEIDPEGNSEGFHSFVGQNIILRCLHEQNGEYVNDKWEFPFGNRSHSEPRKGISRKLNTLYGRQIKAVAATPTARPTEAQEAPKPRRGRPPKAAAPTAPTVAEARDESEAAASEDAIPF